MITAVLTLVFLGVCVAVLKVRSRDRLHRYGGHVSLEAELHAQTVEASERERIDFPELELIRWTALDDHQLTRVLRESAE